MNNSTFAAYARDKGWGMGRQVGAIASAIAALVNRDEAIAQKVLEEDAEIDRMEVDVEEEIAASVTDALRVQFDLQNAVILPHSTEDAGAYEGSGVLGGTPDRITERC